MEEEWETMMDNCDRMDMSGTTRKCLKCYWRFKYQKTLTNHVLEKHKEGEEETACVYCSTGEPHPRLQTYTCDCEYKCEICNCSANSKRNLINHMKSNKHHNNVQRTISALTPTAVHLPTDSMQR